MPGFGEGLGQVIGGMMAAEHLDQGKRDVSATAGHFGQATDPYNTFGQSFLEPAAGGISEVRDKAGETMGYNQFAANYMASPGVKYQLDQATEAQNNSAASRGQLLSGTNLRALSTINQGIASTGMNTAYDQYLKGNNQQFGQLETALGNMFGAIGVGTTATGQQAGVANAQMGAQANLAAAQAKNDQSKGSGFGSIFGGLGSLATGF